MSIAYEVAILNASVACQLLVASSITGVVISWWINFLLRYAMPNDMVKKTLLLLETVPFFTIMGWKNAGEAVADNSGILNSIPLVCCAFGLWSHVFMGIIWIWFITEPGWCDILTLRRSSELSILFQKHILCIGISWYSWAKQPSFSKGDVAG